MQRRFLFFSGLLVLMLAVTSTLFSIPPKREFRGAWIATVVNLDWPSSPHLNTQAQKQELIDMFDGLKALGINAVVFQVRTECDALYPSDIDPWSYWLTGQQGTAPSPMYDPLEFAVREAHKRGMELHAWLNPYRAERSVGNYPLDATHVVEEHPDWILRFGGLKILDPGLPMVRDYVVNVIEDIVTRYDVDGIHFDDYFYPYSGITNEDNETFAEYPRGFNDRGDWRRDNVNVLIEQVYAKILEINHRVKFGVSPFGIYKNGVPSGIIGLDAYNVIYSDPVTWVEQEWLDYLTPQLYWPFGGGQDYGKLMPWWASQTGERHLYVGQGAYRIANWSNNEMPRQIRLNREQEAEGSIYFRADIVLDNPRGFADSLVNHYYASPALRPCMPWKDDVPPSLPQDMQFVWSPDSAMPGFEWSNGGIAADGEETWEFVLYRTDGSPTTESLENPQNIVRIGPASEFFPPPPPPGGPYHYSITALDRLHNESEWTGNLTEPRPPLPDNLLASADESEAGVDVTFSWSPPDSARFYQLQLSVEPSFTVGLIQDEYGFQDTVITVAGISTPSFYWRVRAGNLGGTSAFTEAQLLTTGIAPAPLLAFPDINETDVPLGESLVWYSSPGAVSYHVQVASRNTFNETSMVVDQDAIEDTTYGLQNLEPERYYFWRVAAVNTFGKGPWSNIRRFKTAIQTGVAKGSSTPDAFTLEQNYPNPFNPLTTIAFNLPATAPVQLVVYDIRGREVAVLVDHEMARGPHQISFDGRHLPSGVYLYHLRAGEQTETRRMVLIK